MKKIKLIPSAAPQVALRLNAVNKGLPDDYTMDADWLCSTPLMLEDYLFDLGFVAKHTLAGITATVQMQPLTDRSRGSTRGRLIHTNVATIAIQTAGTWLVGLEAVKGNAPPRRADEADDWRISIRPTLSPAHEKTLIDAIRTRYELLSTTGKTKGKK